MHHPRSGMWTSAVPLPHARADQQSIDRGSWVLCKEIALEASTIQQLSGQPDATEQPFSQPDARWVDAFVSAIKGQSRFQRQSQRGSSARTTCNPGGGLSRLTRYLPMGVASRSPRVGTFGGANLGIGNLPIHVGSAALRRLDLEYIGYGKKTLLSWRPVAVILFFFLW